MPTFKHNDPVSSVQMAGHRMHLPAGAAVITVVIGAASSVIGAAAPPAPVPQVAADVAVVDGLGLGRSEPTATGTAPAAPVGPVPLGEIPPGPPQTPVPTAQPIRPPAAASPPPTQRPPPPPQQDGPAPQQQGPAPQQDGPGPPQLEPPAPQEISPPQQDEPAAPPPLRGHIRLAP